MEVYEAVSSVVTECLKVSDMSLFDSNYGKSLSLDEFKAQQMQSISNLLKYLKEPWLKKIVQSIRLCLRDVGKGWFDLEQKVHHVYDVMKLKRFMELSTLLMQVSILFFSLSLNFCLNMCV